MTNILIVNYVNRFNKGSTALVNSMMGAISNFIPDSKFTVLAYRANYDQYPIKVVETIGNDSSAQVAIKTLSLIIKSYFWMLFYRIFGWF